jgi:hypothetical protein
VSPSGTAAYEDLNDLPPLVTQAVRLARREGFENSCRPEHGRLLLALAGGAEVIGETGTGCGVGLAWLPWSPRAAGPGKPRRQLPSRRFSGAPGWNEMWSKAAVQPWPTGDWARKPTRTSSAASPPSAK